MSFTTCKKIFIKIKIANNRIFYVLTVCSNYEDKLFQIYILLSLSFSLSFLVDKTQSKNNNLKKIS